MINFIRLVPQRISRRIRLLFAPFKLAKLYKDGLPKEFTEGLTYLLKGKASNKVLDVSARIEEIRREIAAGGSKPVKVLYSPKPGSSGNVVMENLKPQHGKILDFSMEQISKTGKNERWGVYLHLLASSFQVKTILELGSCVGISGCYLSSVPSCETFITVEGSEDLAAIAEKNIKQLKPDAQILNMLFDDALDEILPSLKSKIDFAFIDGHHEKIATIHYFERLIPYLSDGAVVVFDDVSWSHDMRDAWNILSQRGEFSHSVDLGHVGISLINLPIADNIPKYWDLQTVLGKKKIGNPHGWQK